MKWNLHWLEGKIETVEGTTIGGAFTNAGYGNGALKALDYVEDYDLVRRNVKIVGDRYKGKFGDITEQFDPDVYEDNAVYIVTFTGSALSAMFSREEFVFV